MQNDHYRPDIDGIRAVAVLLVIFFHFFPQIIPAGFIGVDIFFPISGFLISGIIFEDLKKDNFKFSKFYDRRIRRIFPSLIAVLFFSFLAGCLLLTNLEYISLTKNIAAGAGFLSNIYLWRDKGYFHPHSEFNPLLHLWSLGVEEQFYIFWPLILFLCWRYHRSSFVILSLIFLVSFGLNIKEVKVAPEATFYLLSTRLWELASGGLLGYFYSFQEKFPQKLTRFLNLKTIQNIISLSGVSSIILGIVLIHRTRHFPGWWATLPVFGTTLIIAAGKNAWVNQKILSRKLLIFIGVISYPLYLWHWPLITFSRIVGLSEPTILFKTMLLLTAGMLSWLTYRYIETPIRKRYWKPQLMSPTFALITGMLVMGLMSLAAAKQFLPQTNFQKISQKFEFGLEANRNDLSEEYAQFYREECNFVNREEKGLSVDPSCYVPKHKKTVFIWGDSHAQHLNIGLKDYFQGRNISILQIASSACPPQLPPNHPQDPCDRANLTTLAKIAQVSPDVVILSEQGSSLDVARLTQAISELHKAGIKDIIFVGPNPEWSPDLYKIVLRHYVYFNKNIPERISFGQATDPFDIDNTLKKLFSKDKSITYISLIGHLCNSNGCLVKTGEAPSDLLLIDSGHFSRSASDMVANTILGPAVDAILQ